MLGSISLCDLYANLKKHMPDHDARFVLQKRAGVSWSEIVSNPELEISGDIAAQIQEDLEQLKSGIPITRLYGTGHFYGREFILNDATLDPRQDTEILIDLVKARFQTDQSFRILDMGTGTGCIFITLLAEFPNASGIASDISKEALECAKENAIKHGIDSRAEFTESNWFDNIEGEFDLVVSNPPYIDSGIIETLDENVRQFDPILALDGGTDGMQAYKEIFSNLFSHFKEDGLALFEIGYDQREKIMRLVENYGFACRDVHEDLACKPRVAEVTHGDNVKKNNIVP